MSTVVGDYVEHKTSGLLARAKEEFERYVKTEECSYDLVFGQDGHDHLTTRGWWKIVLHKDVEIRALKRQVNRILEGKQIEGDDDPYTFEEEEESCAGM